jgi:hypothetical protein
MSVTLLAEGRQPVTFGGWSEGRPLRAGLVTQHSGGSGAPQRSQACADCVNLSARGNRTALQGACWTGTGRQCPRPRKRGPGLMRNQRFRCKSRGGAPKGAPAGVIGRLSPAYRRSARPRGGSRVRRCAPAPIGAPPPRLTRGFGTTAYPAPPTIGAAERWLIRNERSAVRHQCTACMSSLHCCGSRKRLVRVTSEHARRDRREALTTKFKQCDVPT